MYSSFENLSKIISLIKDGKIGIIPTDTIYGLVGSALNPQTVEEIYQLRKRAKDKPMIILISDLNDLNHFNVKLTEKQREFLEKVWPNPVSIILPVGKKSLAFRIPKDYWLRKLLEEVGPLVAPSANIEGEKPSETIVEAKKYFGDQVAFYLDGGRIDSNPSTLIKLNEDASYEILRKGNFII